MTKERFKQLWKTLVEDSPLPKEQKAENLLPTNGVSPKLKQALLKNSEEKVCMASLVPKD